MTLRRRGRRGMAYWTVGTRECDSDNGGGQRAHGLGVKKNAHPRVLFLLLLGLLDGVLDGGLGRGGLLLCGVGVRGGQERRDERAEARHLYVFIKSAARRVLCWTSTADVAPTEE
ncbi:hypothetical protein DFH09DRAFT_1098885 [Mycena vulgaris]|nr:hypothetical protein DFH09DRAFT_1098885 [Mycena vulgaris]